MGLSDEQLAIEYNAAVTGEQDWWKRLAEILQDVIVNTYGLNLLNLFDQETGEFKDINNIPEDERRNFLPLVAYTARADIVAPIYKKIKERMEAAEMQSVEEYDKMTEAIANEISDMEPILPENEMAKNPEAVRKALWSSPEKVKELSKIGVTILNDEMAGTFKDVGKVKTKKAP